MPKRTAALNSAQLAFTFEPPAPAKAEADLAGLDKMVSASVARALKDDPRSHQVIAAEMSTLLSDEISAHMLYAYAAESRDGHNISVARFFALVAVTERFDILSALAARIGAGVLVGEEMHTARLGHLKAQVNRLQAEIRAVERQAQPIVRGGVAR